MDKNSRVIVVGAGIFGLSAAYQLASEGYQNILVLDRNIPPVRLHLVCDDFITFLTFHRLPMPQAMISHALFDSITQMRITWTLHTKPT